MPAGTKYPWESKTIVINAILGVVGVAALFVPAASGVAAWINANGVMIATGWSVMNIILRTVTKDKIVLGD